MTRRSPRPGDTRGPLHPRAPGRSECRSHVNELQDHLYAKAIENRLPVRRLHYELVLPLVTSAGHMVIRKVTSGRCPNNPVLIRRRKYANRLKGNSRRLRKVVDGIISDLENETYQWGRPIRIRTGRRWSYIRPIRDQILETAITLLLGPLVEPHLHEQNFGWREGRSALMAKDSLEQAMLRDYTYVIRTDIKAFYESIPHVELLAALQKFAVGRRFIGLIKGLLPKEGKGKGVLEGTSSTTTQDRQTLSGMKFRPNDPQN